MATVREGQKSALLVIDVQNGVVGTCYDRDRIVGNIAKVLGFARTQNRPVIFVRHVSESELPEDSEAGQIVPDLRVGTDDRTLTKRYNSAFEDTALETHLAELGVSKLVIVGAATNWCIRATTFGALARGYDVVLIADAHTTESMVLSPERTIAARDIIDELNAGVRYVAYPGVTTEVPTTEEFIGA